MALREGAAPLDVYADASTERLGTPATVVTAARVVLTLMLGGLAIREESLPLLVASLAVYWVGDIVDGTIARVMRCETRIGAVLDILCDRISAAVFYLGLAWLEPELTLPVLVYLTEFLVVDGFLSLAFLAWPIRSPNYFHVVDHTIWLWNWSTPAKAANSAIFAVLLLATGEPLIGLAVATALLAVKCASLARLAHLGLPVPAR
jgi:CDP-diacylglycerol--glycerol-3-phosphate 3-phosphatidyltransferase